MEGAIFIHFTPKGPYLAPSDFHMFGPMKEDLRGRRFSCLLTELKESVKRWNQCVEIQVDYVGK
jgi:hypothetical protein